jgi:hypothetical protein
VFICVCLFVCLHVVVFLFFVPLPVTSCASVHFSPQVDLEWSFLFHRVVVCVIVECDMGGTTTGSRNNVDIDTTVTDFGGSAISSDFNDRTGPTALLEDHFLVAACCWEATFLKKPS